ncbi:hypothetical protein G7L40_20380 [Paenibacillus polymyxa]|uniref:Uncharacterized protein n=1 Tax=Paenibacillus polymyxa TaxID=1406 RepID=A0A378Y089_PAEPO|nr:MULTISPECIES: hypothetical protein [Paenibacillus]KAF6620529.1 hypothetical protein HFE00_05615 [Paenibacillus sp. EKM101P]KAF6623521.1 hypothetical protein HFE03_07710 [Paenibacillus sp. EKM102P]KAF6633915.1 hypothetical protein HFE01_06795 [Paenibacillus sp. EKM10P]KAF6649443.1 hypothetical protein HFE02_01760 [Paenibacillus sp. EKM11P]MBE7896153.1 hypothetical protein [Paenibacillus polymyxa]
MGRFDNNKLQVNEKRMILQHYKAIKETLLELQEETMNNLDYSAFERTIEFIDNKVNLIKNS